MVLGPERLERWREPTSLSPGDRLLIEETRRRRGRVHIGAIRARNELGECVWSFDPNLTGTQVEELGYLLTCVLLPVHRRMLANGVAVFAHTEWGTLECYAMRQGVRRLLAELRAHPHPDAALTEIDLWILRNMLFHFSLSLQHVTTHLLPHQIRLLERRWDHVSELLTKLPSHFVD
jgi:hypothetical protein